MLPRMLDSGSPAPGIVWRRLSLLTLFVVLVAAGSLPSAAHASKIRLADLKIATTPELYPTFDPSIRRYVTRCVGDRTRIQVRARHRTRVRVDGGRKRSGVFHARVPLNPGAAVDVRARKGSKHGHYEIRCLPQDFPLYTFERFGGPTPQWQLMTVGDYVVIFDRNGVPTWWLNEPHGVNDAKVLPDGNLAWWTNGMVGPYGTDPAATYVELGPSGRIKRKVRAVGLNTDLHDMQQLPNGNYLVMAYEGRSNVDLTAYGQESDSTVLEPVIQEINPDGDLVWSWHNEGRIGLGETGRWWPALQAPFYDILHLNSVEPAGDSLIVSFRHADAVYSIDRASGKINWKLGGTATSKSLVVKNDPYGDYPLGGQHDARYDRHGHLTIFDDQTDPACGGRPPGPKCQLSPRAVEYKIDEKAGTARLINSFTDPKVDSTWCCGGVRKTRNRGWTVAWGGAQAVTGFAPDGSITQRYDFSPGLDIDHGIYRVVPLGKKDFTFARLRHAMDRIYTSK